MKKLSLVRRVSKISVLLTVGFSFLLAFCQQKETDYASLFDQVTADPVFLNYIRTSDEISVLIASEKFDFPNDVRASEIAQTLQNASNRVTYLKKIGCTGDVEAYIQLQSENIDYKLGIVKNHPNIKPSEFRQICTDYRSKQANKPDIINIAKTALDEKASKK
jgi:hypothetical protein